MRYPKLKHPGLCRILTYVIVIGGCLLPAAVVSSFPVLDIIKAAAILASLIGLLIYIIKNFVVLMGMDTILASLSCYRTARKQYTLPKNQTPETIRRRILRFGTSCAPASHTPQPFALRYQFKHDFTVYSRGIEQVLAAYEVDQLDKDTYRSIITSAKRNSGALSGRKKALFLDRSQKEAPLHRVTVALILARKIDPQIAADLYNLVCRQCGDEEEDCIIPCVIDTVRCTCVFNCLRVPYTGFSYAVKNRGIRLIKNRIFGGNLNLRGNTMYVLTNPNLNQDDSLWDLWRELHHQFIGAERQTKRRFEAMAEKEIFCEEEFLYLKWDQRGICQSIMPDYEKKVVQVEQITDWYYPKMQPIGKKTIGEIQKHITSYFENSGYSAEFVSIEDIT